jgi:hypothetical protein
MNTLRIAILGLVAITAALIVATISVRRDEMRKKQGLKSLREMTPESLIANCGEPTSDTDLRAPHPGWALTRVVTYKTAEYPWVKLEFIRNPGKPWRLSHFSSPTVGVAPADENAYIAIPEFPCMAKSSVPIGN